MFKKVNRLIIAATLACTMPMLSSCSLATAVGGGISSPVPQGVELALKKRYLQALTGAMGLEKAAELSVDMGLIKPGSSVAIKVADGLVALKKAMDLADTAFKANDAVNLEANVGIILNQSGIIKSALGLK